MKISIENRQKVLNLHGAGHNQCQISNILSVSRYAVQNIIKKHREGLLLHDKQRSDIPKKLNIRDERLIARESRKNPFFTAREIRYYESRRRRDRYTAKTVKYPMSIISWGAILSDGKRVLIRCNGNFDSR